MKCPLCQARAEGRITTPPPDVKTYRHCGFCDLIFLEGPYPARDEEHRRYLEHENTPDNTGYVRMLESFLKQAVLPYINEGSALDFGSGPGPVLADLMADIGFDVAIYDPFFAPCPDVMSQQYHLITATEVMEHVFYPGHVIAELNHCLLSSGILALMTHFHPGVAEFINWWYHRDPTHVMFYSLRTMNWIACHFDLTMLKTDKQKIITFRKN